MRGFTYITVFVVALAISCVLVVVAQNSINNFWPGTAVAALVMFFVPQIGRGISSGKDGCAYTLKCGVVMALLVFVVAMFSDDIYSVSMISSLMILPGMALGERGRQAE